MTFEIGQLTVTSTATATLAPRTARVERPAPARPVGTVDRSDVIPASPPPAVLAEVDAAWERAAQLFTENRELHFARDEGSGRMVIQVRTLDGEVLKTIPPARALEVMDGGAL